MEVKLIGAFVLVSLIAVIVGAVGLRSISIMNDRVNQIYERELLGISYVKEANISLLYIARAERNMLLSTTGEDREKYGERLKKYEETYCENMQKAVPLFRSDKGKELLSKVDSAWQEYRDAHIHVVDLAMQDELQQKRASVDYCMGPARQKMQILDEALTDLERHKEENAKAASEETARIYKSSNILMTGFMLAGMILGIILGTLLTIGITRPIKRIIAGLSEASEQVASASGQVASAGRQLAEGASEQAAALEESASAIEEMASTARQSSNNAVQANGLMVETLQVIDHSTASLAELTASMQEISKASEEISKIVKTIDGIAFQTNLLALNAAVEAARAGEAGTGFAVVADEVRSLAMRSAQAAKSTAALIDDSVHRIQMGSVLVSKTNDTFAAVSKHAITVSNLVGEITSASGEQSRGAAEISGAITQVDIVVQQNATNAEESASASEELNRQALHMKEFVDALLSLFGRGRKHGLILLRLPHKTAPL
jgi:methyl-accepting chemotaxis protein